jgi:hypothetical protein
MTYLFVPLLSGDAGLGSRSARCVSANTSFRALENGQPSHIRLLSFDWSPAKVLASFLASQSANSLQWRWLLRLPAQAFHHPMAIPNYGPPIQALAYLSMFPTDGNSYVLCSLSFYCPYPSLAHVASIHNFLSAIYLVLSNIIKQKQFQTHLSTTE